MRWTKLAVIGLYQGRNDVSADVIDSREVHVLHPVKESTGNVQNAAGIDSLQQLRKCLR